MNDNTLAELEQLIQLRRAGSLSATEFEKRMANQLNLAQSQPVIDRADSLLSITPPPKWSYLKTFWLETLRTALLTGVGLLATSLLLNPIQGAITKQANAAESQASAAVSERDKDIRIRLVDQFLEKSYIYTAVMNEAQTYPSYKKRYGGSVDEGYGDMKNRLRLYYSTHKAIMDSLAKSDELAKQLFKSIEAGLPKRSWAANRDQLKRLNNQIAVSCLQAVGVQIEQPNINGKSIR
ncbi:hypothetical protein [Spirosoma arcticum]